MERFDRKTAVISGGATGIGKAVTVALASAGTSVYIAGRDRERGEDVVAELQARGYRVSFLTTDVADDEQVGALAAHAARASGRIDIWFNNAGTEGQSGPLDEVDDTVVAQLLAVNVKGTYSGMRHAIKKMTAGGVIINHASANGSRVFIPTGAAYGATKAAIVSLTRAAAIGLSPQGISVFAICPWIVDTLMIDRIATNTGYDKSALAASFAPSGRITTPEEVASIVLDLCSETTTFHTGDVLLVDAGGTTELLMP